jgi:[ribosomal protein S5]-alanine N-acetyltransferase
LIRSTSVRAKPERWSVHGEMADTVNDGLLRRYWDER